MSISTDHLAELGAIVAQVVDSDYIVAEGITVKRKKPSCGSGSETNH